MAKLWSSLILVPLLSLCHDVVAEPSGKMLRGTQRFCFVHEGCETGAAWSGDASNSMGRGYYCTDNQYVDDKTIYAKCRLDRQCLSLTQNGGMWVCYDGLSDEDDLATFKAGFEGQGILASVNGKLSQDDGYVEGASVQRKDLPLAFWSQTGVAWGIIYQPLESPKAPKTECGFPFDADTDRRCSKTGGACRRSRCSAYDWDPKSGNCEDIGITNAEQYIARYTADDVFSHNNFFATCFFTNVSTMVEVQKAFLAYLGSNQGELKQRSWKGPTFYDEAIVDAPYSSANVLGVFWAHSGDFVENYGRYETDHENGACAFKTWPGYEDFPYWNLPLFEISRAKVTYGGRVYSPDMSSALDSYTSTDEVQFAETIRLVPREVVEGCV